MKQKNRNVVRVEPREVDDGKVAARVVILMHLFVVVGVGAGHEPEHAHQLLRFGCLGHAPQTRLLPRPRHAATAPGRQHLKLRAPGGAGIGRSTAALAQLRRHDAPFAVHVRAAVPHARLLAPRVRPATRRAAGSTCARAAPAVRLRARARADKLRRVRGLGRPRIVSFLVIVTVVARPVALRVHHARARLLLLFLFLVLVLVLLLVVINMHVRPVGFVVRVGHRPRRGRGAALRRLRLLRLGCIRNRCA